METLNAIHNPAMTPVVEQQPVNPGYINGGVEAAQNHVNEAAANSEQSAKVDEANMALMAMLRMAMLAKDQQLARRIVTIGALAHHANMVDAGAIAFAHDQQSRIANSMDTPATSDRSRVLDRTHATNRRHRKGARAAAATKRSLSRAN